MIPVETSVPARGHYTPGMIAGGLLFISGQTSADPKTGKPAEGGFEAEMRMALSKLDEVLQAAGCTRNDVVMVHLYTPSAAHWDAANKIYAEFFGDHKPARIALPAPELSLGCQVEIDAIAEVKK